MVQILCLMWSMGDFPLSLVVHFLVHLRKLRNPSLTATLGYHSGLAQVFLCKGIDIVDSLVIPAVFSELSKRAPKTCNSGAELEC